MAILKKTKTKKKSKVEEKTEIKEIQKIEESPKAKKEEKNLEAQKVEKVEKKETKPKIIRKGTKIIANGRCFGAPSLECPLKTVRNYETKILDIDKARNSVLIDEGWISKNFIK